VLGLILYELHAAILERSDREMNEEKLEAAEFQLRLLEVAKVLNQCIGYLKYEPEGMRERQVCESAVKLLEEVKEFIKQVKSPNTMQQQPQQMQQQPQTQ
jgi:hypothetical protein